VFTTRTASQRLLDLVDDLSAETSDALRILVRLTESEWEAPTPAVGWSVRDQVSHLARFDDTARLAMTSPRGFRELAEEDEALGPDFPDQIARELRDIPAADLLRWFRRSRTALCDTFRRVDPALKLPWYGPPMSAATSATARIMETWAHLQDVADTFGLEREATARLRHVAHLGIRTRGYSFAVNDLAVPAAEVRVDLAAPGGGTWTWGPLDAADRIEGPAVDFCLLVTQRRHRDDLALVITGPVADAWTSIAQAFAGGPGAGRLSVAEKAESR
jgi:uncharacterized protein (TIGR03084 family)